MDKGKKTTLETELDEAERHVEEGERLIERQRRSIEERRRDGHDNDLATNLLGELEEAQRNHIAHRDLIRRELAMAQRDHTGGRRDTGERRQ
jgi:hypothetical protein